MVARILANDPPPTKYPTHTTGVPGQDDAAPPQHALPGDALEGDGRPAGVRGAAGGGHPHRHGRAGEEDAGGLGRDDVVSGEGGKGA